METYEKKYREALERARKYWESQRTCFDINALTEIFPELAESEDEKIRKAIHIYLDWLDGRKDYAPRGEYSIRDMIAWLEKQGTPNQVSIWKHWKNGIAGNGEGEPIYLTKVGNTYSLNSCLGFECDYIELSELDNLMLVKQGEQNPYSGVNFSYNGNIWGMCARDNGVDILFNKKLIQHICEKQGEQKSVVIIPKFRVGDEVITENEESLTITRIDEEGYWSNDLFICDFDSERIWNLVEQYPTEWSEEDEKNSYHLKTLLENLTKDNKYEFRIISDNDRDKYTTWLKSVKDRVQPQNNEDLKKLKGE